MKRLLVIDDETATRRLIGFTLKSLGIDVVGAADATSGLEMAASQEFDMMLVDINLPDIDGFTLFQKLQLNHRDIPIIIFTARNNPDDEAYAQELGAAGFLYKPFSTQELRQLVSHHLTLE